ncbi:hypothetical protein GGI21_004946, partial [Coemansia aciculifera]
EHKHNKEAFFDAHDEYDKNDEDNEEDDGEQVDEVKSVHANFSNSIFGLLLTISPRLQHLALTICEEGYVRLQRTMPLSFADSLISLTLEGKYDQQDVEHLLPKFPNLRILNICASVSKPISDMPSSAQSLTPPQ